MRDPKYTSSRRLAEYSRGKRQDSSHAAEWFSAEPHRSSGLRRNSIGRGRRSSRPSGDLLTRVSHDREAAPRQVPSLRQSCERIAERIRISVRVTGCNASREQPAATGMLWLGLLLCAFACTGLFVSLLLRSRTQTGGARARRSPALDDQRTLQSRKRTKRFWRSSSSSAEPFESKSSPSNHGTTSP
jgi:hypothetical protein